MASSVSAPVVVPQATKRTHAEMSGAEAASQPNILQPSLPLETPGSAVAASDGNPPSEDHTLSMNSETANNATNVLIANKATNSSNSCSVKNDTAVDQCSTKGKKNEVSGPTKSTSGDNGLASDNKAVVDGASSEKAVDGPVHQDKNKDVADSLPVPTSSALAPSSQSVIVTSNSETTKSTPEPMETSVATASQDTARPNLETAAAGSTVVSSENSNQLNTSSSDISSKPNSSNAQLEDGEEPEKKAKLMPSSGSGKATGKTPEQILEHMDKTFEQRRKIITKQMPTIPELKKLYPDLFMGKQLLIEFQRITKIDIDQKIQEFCVRYATAVIEMARNKKGAAPVLARWEQAKQENDTLKQYWDMVTALCLLPLHFGENFVEMVLEIGEDEEVVAQGKIVPTLVARGNIFRTDEFFLIAENTIVQEFEEFTIAFASLYSSYWVFNMMYPETIENTYNYIQRCIVRQREPGSIPTVCKNFTKALQKWNKAKEGK
ncbi:unnamed protein product [Lymnaea stagnalis]|uniref:Uncharacterized protein n=1 Tax=Lymnaea stagnalis TaxID=6523 RepID=A0AAV2I7N4_LYMST